MALRGHISQQAWPIADAEGGNYVCLRREPSGAWGVVFWDHELEEETAISSTFSEFLDSLRNFDPASVELKPGQLISVWIDPSLLANHDE
ncbi:MAG: SMI1/KNR4 family protein [Myxococcota bacterium]